MVTVVLATLAVVPTAPAAAATVEIRPDGDPQAPVGFGDIGVVAFAASPGETNAVTVTATDSGYEITDSGATITPGAGCAASGPHTVMCSRSDIFLVIELGDGDDRVSLDFVEYGVVVRAGEGDDIVVGGDSFSELLYGGPGNDQLSGGGESDIIDGGPGADVMSGGTSWHTHANSHIAHPDRVSYAGRTLPVRADLDGLADDGEPGEGDRILGDFEILEGGSGADVLVGNRHSNYLYGGRGNDDLDGRGRHDQLWGAAGDDRLRGGRGKDRLRGNAGDDIVVGGVGIDWIAGGSGGDILLSRDGTRDEVGGGDGRDRARVDPYDDVRSVERVLSRFF